MNWDWRNDWQLVAPIVLSALIVTYGIAVYLKQRLRTTRFCRAVSKLTSDVRTLNKPLTSIEPVLAQRADRLSRHVVSVTSPLLPGSSQRLLVDGSAIFSMQTVDEAMGARGDALAIPGRIVSVGLLVTFAGLMFSIIEAYNAVNPESGVEEVAGSMAVVLEYAGIKFATSVFALATAIPLDRALRAQYAQAAQRMQALAESIAQELPLLTPAEAALVAANGTTAAVAEVKTVANAAATKLSEAVGVTLTAAVADGFAKLQTHNADELKVAAATLSQALVDQTADFRTELAAAATQIKMFSESAAKVPDELGATLRIHRDALQNETQAARAALTGLLSGVVTPLSDGLAGLPKELNTTLGTHREALQNDTQAARDALKGLLLDKLTPLSTSVTNLSSEVEKAERTADALAGAVAELKSIAKTISEQARSLGESSGAMAETLSGATTSLGSQLSTVSQTVEREAAALNRSLDAITQQRALAGEKSAEVLAHHRSSSTRADSSPRPSMRCWPGWMSGNERGRIIISRRLRTCDDRLFRRCRPDFHALPGRLVGPAANF